MTPHKCPVCNGAGQVWPINDFKTTSIPGPTPCRACGGTGIVWEQIVSPLPQSKDGKALSTPTASHTEGRLGP